MLAQDGDVPERPLTGYSFTKGENQYFYFYGPKIGAVKVSTTTP